MSVCVDGGADHLLRGSQASDHFSGEEPMKITRILVHAVSVLPRSVALYRLDKTVTLEEQLRSAAKHKWIVEVETDEGFTGVGESHRGISEESVREVLQPLLGLDPLRLNLRNLPGKCQTCECDPSEIALYDLVGKALGYPMSHLLGGPFREWIPVHYWMGKRTPEESVAIALEAREKGFKGIKIKCGNDAPEHDTVKRIEAIRKEVGNDLDLQLDANGGFAKHPDIVGLCDRLLELGVSLLEDPVHRTNPEALAELRPKVQLPLAYHAVTLDQAMRAVRLDVAEAMNCSGVSLFVRVGDLADAAGLPSWHGSAMELGIRDTAFMHACAASRGTTLSSDLHHLMWEDDLLVEGIEIVNGQARLPDGPGLGVELDRDAVARHRVEGFEL
jgi:muconate cycloisomerase